ncbi:MAG: hypothetical protein ABSH39_16810, partial [Candidatus Acidiferrum sp.]
MQITCAKLQRRGGVLPDTADKKRLNYCLLACLLLPMLLIGGCAGLVSQDVKASNPQVYTLSGTISPAAGGSGATVTLSGAASATTTANSSGAFSFTGLANGAYIITPIHTGYTLSPASQNATINGANVSGMSFTATAQVAPTYTISGTLSPSAGG